MAKKDMKSALKGTMLMEEKAIVDRFERAESLLSQKGKIDTNPPEKVVNLPKKQKIQKVKVIRDSFTMPQTDYDLIGALKKRSLLAGVEITKSEIIRVGLNALNQMNETEFLNKIGQIEKIKTGRPKQTV